jgi:hypothetical protein
MIGYSNFSDKGIGFFLRSFLSFGVPFSILELDLAAVYLEQSFFI